MSGSGAPAYPAVLASPLVPRALVPDLVPTAFDLLGGPPAVRDAVWRWLRLVEADAALAPYLVGVDVPRLAGHLAMLLTTALGGPAGDIARPVVDAWRGLGLTEAYHRRVVDYLTGVLWAMDLPAADIALVGQAFAGDAAP
ncbi:globin [Micromonospora sp. NPDC049559]|uniref:globin domain-containing protein n=1 Tax=Micromonospora sp. NPDC049559 TaxID=3155923 RepID=UPI00341A42B6